MMIRACKSKIHRATVTRADLDPKIVIVEGDDNARKLTDRNQKFRLLAHSKVRNAPRKRV